MRSKLSYALVLGIAILSLPAPYAAAQERQRVSFPTSPQTSKYTQQHLIEVGDLPGHFIRLFELYRTFPKDPPMIGGVALKEQWSRGFTDYASNTGPGVFYGVYMLENGDKFFTYSNIVAHKAGSGLSAVTVGRITGGTGRFANVRGTVRTVLTADPEAGINDGWTEIEYVLGAETDAKKESPRTPPARPGNR